MKNYLLFFHQQHESTAVFLLEDCEDSEKEAAMIEELMSVPQNERAAYNTMACALRTYCFESRRFQHNPEDNILSGEVIICNFTVRV
jgi:hypothetical protein